MKVKTNKYLTAFGKHLREVREKNGLSQEQLAAAADLDRTFVSSCERGVRNISLVNIYKLAEALKVEPGFLLPNQIEKKQKLTI